jgi:hypothetical protein
MALSHHIVHVVVEVMDDGATDMTENKRNHGNENHLNGGRHCPMTPQQDANAIRWTFDLTPIELFAFAEMWDRWKEPSGNWIKTCSISPRPRNAVTSPVHDRMPNT